MQRVLSVIVVGVVTLFYHLALCFHIPLLPIYCTKTSRTMMDAEADLVFHDSIGKVLTAVAEG